MSRFVITKNVEYARQDGKFKPSKHEVIHFLWFKNIQLRNSQQNLNLKSTNPTKTRIYFFVCFDKHRHKQTELEI